MERLRSRHSGAPSKEAAPSSRSSGSSLQLSSTSPANDAAPAASAPSLSSGVGAAASTALVDDGLSDRLASLTLSPGSDKEAATTGGGLLQTPPEQYDAVIIHDPEDEGKAELFRRNLVGIVGPDLRVTQFGCDALNAGRLHYDALEDTIRRSTYMLLLVTKKFCAGDGRNIMLRDTCLSEMLNNDGKRWCLIPVWTAPEEEYTRPMALRPLTGISEKNMADTFRSQSIIKLFSEKRQHREKRQQEVQERLTREARDRQRKEEELEGQRKHREILQMAEEEIKKQLLSKRREAELEELHARHERAVQEEAHEAELKQTLERLEQGEQVIRHTRDQQAFAQWQREQQARMAAQLLAAAAQEDAAMAGGSGGGVPPVLHLRGGYASGTLLSGSGGDRSAASAAMAAAATAHTAAAVGGSQPSSAGFGPLTANGIAASRAASHQPWPLHGFGPPEGAGGRTAAEAAVVQQWQLFQARLQPGAFGFVPVAGAASASQAVLPPPYSSSLLDSASGGRGRLPLQDRPASGQHSGPGILPAAAANTIYGPNPWAGSAVAWPSVGPAVAGVPRSGGDSSSPALAAAAAVPRLSGNVVPPPTKAVAAADAQPAHARAPYTAQAGLPSACRSADEHSLMSSGVRHEFVSATSVQPCKATQQQQQWQQQQSDDRPFKKAAAATSSPPKPHDVAIMEESYPPAAGGKAKLQTAVDNLAIARKIEGVRDSQQALLNDCTAMMTSRGAPSAAAAAAAESVLGTPSEAATWSNRGGVTVPARHGGVGGGAAQKSTVEASLQQGASAASSRSSSTAMVAAGPVSSGSRRGPLTIVGATQPLDSAGSIGGSSRAPLPPAVATFRSPMASMSSSQEPPYASAPAGPGGSYDQQILATLLQQQQQLQLQQLQLQHLLALYGAPAVTRPEAPRHLSQQLPPFTATVPTAFGGNVRLPPNSQSVPGLPYELMPTTQCLPPPDSPLWAAYAGGVSPFGTSAAVGGSAQQQQQQSPAFNDHSPGVRRSRGSVVADDALGRATAYSPLQYLPGIVGYGLPWGPEFGAAAATVPGARAVNEHGLDMPTRFPMLPGRLPSPAVGDEGLTGRVTPTSLQCSDFSERGAEEPPSEGDQDLARWPSRSNAGSGRERGQSGGLAPRGSQLPEARSGPMAPSPVGSGSHDPSSWAASSRLSVASLSRDSNLSCDDSGTSGSGSSGGGAATESDGGSSSMHSYSGHSSGGDSGQDGANFHELPYADQAAGASSNSGIPATVLQLRDSLAMRQSSRPGQGSSSTTPIDSSSQCRSTSPGHYHIDGGEDASFIKMQPLTMHPPH